jgi:hypothetical protein
MRQARDWVPRCAFIRDYFFGGQRKIAQQLAAYLAENYLGDDVTKLRPDTDVAVVVAASIRASLHKDDVTLARDTTLFPSVDLKESITFMELVRRVHAEQGGASRAGDH